MTAKASSGWTDLPTLRLARTANAFEQKLSESIKRGRNVFHWKQDVHAA